MIYAGTIIEIKDNKTYIMTMDLDVIAIKTQESYFVGKSINFTKKDEIKEVSQLKLVKSNKFLAIAAAVVVLLIASVVFIGRGFSNKDNKGADSFDTVSTAIVSVDINPSIELEVNKDNKVVKVTAYNDEGTDVLASLKLEEMDLDEAVKLIIEMATEKKYYVEDESTVFVSAVLTGEEATATDSEAADYIAKLKESLENIKISEEDKAIIAVYIDDCSIISDAEKNNLSIGKQLLLKYAEISGKELTAEDLQNLSIEEIMQKLNLDQEDVETILGADEFYESEPEKEEPTTEATTEEKTEATTEEKTTAATTEKKVDKTTEKKTESTSNNQPAGFSPGFSVGTNGSNINFSWNPTNASSVTYNGKTYTNFQYYKVVASASNPNPKYPEDGYLTYITNSGSSSWSLNPATDGYNQSPCLESGKTYYFSVTYVFENGKIYANSASATVPASSTEAPTTAAPTEAPTTAAPTTAAPAAFSPWLSASCSGGVLSCSWGTLPGYDVTYNGTTYTGFNYYKVVASKTNPNPVYPEDGYLYYSCDTGVGYWASSAFQLEAGQTYYVAITYVFGNGKFTSNTVQVTIQ